VNQEQFQLIKENKIQSLGVQEQFVGRSSNQNMLRQLKFNLWVFWHDIRRHNLLAEQKNLHYPLVEHTVLCKTCNNGIIITYRDNYES